MAVPDWLLEKLVCPERPDLHLRRARADALAAVNARIAAGGVADRGGRAVDRPIDEALVRWDGRVLYPVTDGIPRLCKEDGIDL
jgi:uncharacterized protein YbaR (Trm112 family)